MRRFILTASLATLFLLSGCGMATRADWQRCSFDVTDVAFQGFRENQAEWRIVVAAINPGHKNLSLEGLHLNALMEGDTLARLRDPGRVTLAARDTTTLSFDVSMPQTSWNKALRSFRQTGSREVLITGDVVVPTLFGSRRIKDAIREKHVVDLSDILGGMGVGGDFLRGLFGM